MRQEVRNRKRLKDNVMIDSKTTTAKPTSFPKPDATQAFRAASENGSAQIKESFEKMSVYDLPQPLQSSGFIAQ